MKGKLFALLSFAFLMLSSCNGKGESSSTTIEADDYTRAEIYQTTGSKSKLLQRGSDLELEDYQMGSGTEVYVDTGAGREFLGVGAALTHSSAYLLYNADEEVRDEILDKLFAEIGFDVLRIPLGTSDYTIPDEDFYTFDDTEGSADYTLSQFSIEKDERFLIPILKEILERNPDITIFAAPWSAPAWMKTSNDLIGGYLIGYDNTDLDSPSNEEQAYAEYLYKAIEAYDEAGITINYLSIVNEPLVSSVQYPSMRMNPECYFRVAKALCELIEDSPYADLRLDVYDHNVGSSIDVTFENFAQYLLDDPLTNKYVGGFALHCYDGNWPNAYGDFLYNYLQTGDYPEYEDKGFFITEVTESSTGVDFAQNLAWAAGNVTVGPLGYGANAAMYWNIVLNSDGKPVKGNNATCYGIVSLDDGEITYSAAYYALAHVSSFVQGESGQQPIILDAASTSEALIRSSAYLNSNGETVAILANVSDRFSEDVRVVIGEKMVELTLEPQSVSTLVFRTGEAEQFDSIEFEHIDIYQQGIDSYSVEATIDGEYENLEFYCSNGETYDDDDKLESAKEGDVYSFALARQSGDCYLHVTDGTDSGYAIITLPNMNPSIQVLEGEEYVVQAKFGLDTGSSWSSFCDPTGKKVYRSANPTFDETAEQVNVLNDGSQDNIYITTEEYSDTNASADKPYYYFVMEGKSGLVTYHSGAVTFRENIFADESIALSMENGVPSLVYEATDVNGDQQEAALRLKDVDGEIHHAYNQSDDAVRIVFDLTNLEKIGVWYDLFAICASGSGSYEFTTDQCIDYNAKVEYNGISYEFQNWEGVIKINAVSI